MKRGGQIALMLFALLCVTTVGMAQERHEPERPAQPTPEQQKAFAAAQAEAERAYREWKAATERDEALPANATLAERIRALGDIVSAQRRYDLAGAEVRVTVLYVVAKLKLDPDEWRAAVTKDGLLTFERVKQPAK